MDLYEEHEWELLALKRGDVIEIQAMTATFQNKTLNYIRNTTWSKIAGKSGKLGIEDEIKDEIRQAFNIKSSYGDVTFSMNELTRVICTNNTTRRFLSFRELYEEETSENTTEVSYKRILEENIHFHKIGKIKRVPVMFGLFGKRDKLILPPY